MKSVVTIEGLGAEKAIDKLRRAGIPVLSARRTQKNRISLEVDRKDLEKIFAILQGSCYNVKKVVPKGAAKFLQTCRRSAGLLVGLMLFAALVLSAETRVLRIDVVGSGAYYRSEVLEILAREGIEPFSPMPQETNALAAGILSLPRVTFCTFRRGGGIFTVEVAVGDENARFDAEPLRAPVSGRVEELVVIRGTPCVQVGDEVMAGDTVVSERALLGEEETVRLVIAWVKIGYAAEAEYGGTEEEARARAYLDFGEMTGLAVEQTERGWRITGTAYAESSVNLD